MIRTFASKNIDEIVHCYSNTLLKIAYQNTKCYAYSEDILQDVYLKLIKYKGSFESEEHLKAWLIRVTINRCKDHMKSAWFKRRGEMPEEIYLKSPEDQKVMEEIFELEPMDRNIIYLFYYEGYSILEISEILKKNSNTIGSRLRRARQKLKYILEERSLI